MPPWLQAHLEATGAANPDGVSRRARAGICRSCGEVVLRGLDADRAAVTVAADPEPLNPLGEFLATVTARRTYDLSWRGRYELDPRDADQIAERPAALYGKSAVLVEHSCADRMPIEGRIIEPGNHSRKDDDKCPF